MASLTLTPTTLGSDAAIYHTFLSSMEGYESPEDSLSTNSSYQIPFHDPLPGCARPYQLPAGTSTCPIPGCRGYGNKFKPYWRLNEHMKAKHGWPRKNTQPLLDKRINGKSAKFKSKPHHHTSSSSPTPTPLASILKQTQSSPMTPSKASDAPPRERKEFLSAAEKRSLEDWMASQPDTDEPPPIENIIPGAPPIDPERSAEPEIPVSPIPAVDEAMCAEAEAYIAWLDTQKPLHPSQNAVRAVLAQLAARKLFRTGQVLPERVRNGMLALYRILETRAQDLVADTTSAAGNSTASVSPLFGAETSPTSSGKKRTIKFHSRSGII